MKSWPGFDMHFFYGQVCWIFIHFLAIWTSSLEKPLLSILANFFIGSLILGGVEFFEICVYSGYQSLVICIASKCFLPFCRWPLQFTDHLFCCAEEFYFQVVWFVNSFSLLLGNLSSTEEVIAYSSVFPALSYTRFKVSNLILSFLIHIGLILVQDDRHGSSFNFRNSKTMLNEKRQCKHLSCTWLWRNVFSAFPFTILFAVGLSDIGLIMLRHIPFIPCFIRGFIMKGCCILS
jgi:hypothetical protein